MEKLNSISESMLKEFARLEITLLDFSSRVNRKPNEWYQYSGYYKMTLDDAKAALKTAIKRKYTVFDFFANWLFPLFVDMPERLCLTELCPGFPESLEQHRLRYLPMTDDEMLIWVMKTLYLDHGFDEIQYVASQDAAKYFQLDDILESIEDHEFNACMPEDKQSYTHLIMLDYIHEWDNDLILREADESTRRMFKDFVLDLAEQDHPEALRILGYASYDGNSIFECDYELTAECMEKLWRDYSFGYAANTLGYLYMQGKLSGGRPDYRNAFSYFSIGYTFGITESACNVAEMFMNGNYVRENIMMAESILTELYSKALIRFEDGDRETHLADIAVRYGELFLKLYKAKHDMRLISRAHRLFLQAEFALGMESKAGGVIMDSSLSGRIKKNLSKTGKYFKTYKSSHKSDYPSNLDDFILGRGFCNYTLTITPLKNDRFKFTICRNRRGGEENPESNLVSFFEFGCCQLTDSITFVAEGVDNPDKLRKIKGELIFDTVDDLHSVYAPNAFVFMSNGEIVLSVNAAKFEVRNPTSRH